MTLLDELIHSNKPFYFGEMERPETEQTLMNKPNGTWLVRLSPRDRKPVISYISGGKFGHIKGTLISSSNKIGFNVQNQTYHISNLGQFQTVFPFLQFPCSKPSPQPASYNTGVANPQPASFNTGTANPQPASFNTANVNPQPASFNTGTANPQPASFNTAKVNPQPASFNTGTANPQPASFNTAMVNPQPASFNTPAPAPVATNKTNRKSRLSQQVKQHEEQIKPPVQQNMQKKPLPRTNQPMNANPSMSVSLNNKESDIYDIIDESYQQNRFQDIIYYENPPTAVIVQNLTALPSSMKRLTGSLDDKIKIHQVIGNLAEATNPKTGTTGFLLASDFKITNQTKGISKKELDSQHVENASNLAIQQRFLNEFEARIGKSIKIHSKPVMKLKIEPEEIGLPPNKQLPAALPNLQCEVVSIQREYFVDNTHIGFGYDPISKDKKGFFNMATCYSVS